jgi:7,8-dihydroneopterin aldolase/epimerase/oxygenase
VAATLALPLGKVRIADMGQISIENMRFFAYHGCFREEAETGTEFQVDLHMICETADAELSDKLTDTVNYQAVYELVKREMMTRSHLLEHVGRRILDALQEEFPAVDDAELTIYKLHPPVGGQVGSVSVTLSMVDGR